MKIFFLRTLITYLLVSLIITIALVPKFIEGKDEILNVFSVVLFYVLILILVYGVTASIVSNLIGSLFISKRTRIYVKILLYFISLSIFCWNAPRGLIVYGIVATIIYYGIDEIIKAKQKPAS